KSVPDAHAEPNGNDVVLLGNHDLQVGAATSVALTNSMFDFGEAGIVVGRGVDVKSLVSLPVRASERVTIEHNNVVSEVGRNHSVTPPPGTLVEQTDEKGSGIVVYGDARATTIGGTIPTKGNIVSENLAHGIVVEDSLSGGAGPQGTVIEGNLIGVSLTDKKKDIGNYGAGVYIRASNVTVGGTQPGAGNVIANNNFGVQETSNIDHVSVLSNSIYGNAHFGILAPDVVPAPGVIESDLKGGKLTLKVQVKEKSGSAERIQVFANPSCATADENEGKVYLGDMSFTAKETSAVDETVVVPDSNSGTGITVTLTQDSMTSEFSACNHL
ncbi:MAG TPA: hypothetical protein VG815_10805, partial [Chloroflexota bacterium]|nr:hypothetical protein [Chloroflexota bacterium]